MNSKQRLLLASSLVKAAAMAEGANMGEDAIEALQQEPSTGLRLLSGGIGSAAGSVVGAFAGSPFYQGVHDDIGTLDKVRKKVMKGRDMVETGRDFFDNLARSSSLGGDDLEDILRENSRREALARKAEDLTDLLGHALHGINKKTIQRKAMAALGITALGTGLGGYMGYNAPMSPPSSQQ